MKRLISAIARSLAALARGVSRTTWTFCKETGKWLATTVANIGAVGGSPAPVVEDIPEEVVEYAKAEDLLPEDDGSIDRLIQKSKEVLKEASLEYSSYFWVKYVCRDLGEGRPLDAYGALKLSWRQAEWMDAMPQEMHALVGAASLAEIEAHCKGKKTIPGVLRFDKESIAEWKRAEQLELGPDAPAIDYDNEPAWARGRLAAC